MSARTASPDSLDPTPLWALRAVLVPMHPTIASHPDLKAITVLLASTASPERGGLAYLDAVLPAEHRLAATRLVRDLGALPPDAIVFLFTEGVAAGLVIGSPAAEPADVPREKVLALGVAPRLRQRLVD